MGFADFYFERQNSFQVKIEEKPHNDLKYIVVIPCYRELNLIETLNSIREAERINHAVETIIVINSSESANQHIKDQNRKTYNEVKNWIAKHEDSLLRFFVLLEENLPQKFAGAGLARKIGMDQALARLNRINNPEGFILSMDADAMVKPNYFTEIDKQINKWPTLNVFTTYFEHPTCGAEFDSEIYDAITKYELYLRYYKLALAYAGFPYSYYTIGSCFGVNALSYAKQGGMNRKQAGEDFYFLHKVFPLGNVTEINTTCVYPSSRPSDRVPFGTGPMVKAIAESKEPFLTYRLEAFLVLKEFIHLCDQFFKIPKLDFHEKLRSTHESVYGFLEQNNFQSAVEEMNQNSSNLKTFRKRFFSWFDAFRVLKYLNFAHERFYKKKDLFHEAAGLYKLITNEHIRVKNYQDLLKAYRSLERQF
jgi:hypothetical protein